jgi:tetratricopeptide (TPR) repeat protein
VAISGAPEQQLELSRYYDALAKSLERMDRVEEAIRLHERALAIAEDALGPSHPWYLKLQMHYGRALQQAGQLGRARAALEAALANMPATSRESHLDAGKLHTLLSDLSYVAGDLDTATAHARQALQLYQRAEAPERLLAEAHVTLANAELTRKNFGAALELYQTALALRLPHLADHYQTGVNEGSIADALVGLGRHAEAMTHLRRAEGIFERGSARDRATRSWILAVRGDVLVGQGELRAAVPVLEQALSLLEGAADRSNAPRVTWALARALHGLAKSPERVLKLAAQARDLFANASPPDPRNRDIVEQFIARISRGTASHLRPAHGLTR